MADTLKTEASNALMFNPDFLRLLGMFHGAWTSVDQAVDYAIGHFLKIPHEQTHLLTSGMMMFGRKAQLLAGLIARSDHPQKADLLAALNHFRGEVKRDWLVHAYVQSTPTRVTFIHRNTSGEYKVKKLSFSLPEFHKHLVEMTQAGEKFQIAIGLTPEALADFVAAAERAENKATTSPA
jgi:hypothetical protein